MESFLLAEPLQPAYSEPYTEYPKGSEIEFKSSNERLPSDFKLSWLQPSELKETFNIRQNDYECDLCTQLNGVPFYFVETLIPKNLYKACTELDNKAFLVQRKVGHFGQSVFQRELSHPNLMPTHEVLTEDHTGHVFVQTQLCEE